MSIPSSYYFARAELHARNMMLCLKSNNPDKERIIEEGIRYMEYVHKAVRRAKEELGESTVALQSLMR